MFHNKQNVFCVLPSFYDDFDVPSHPPSFLRHTNENAFSPLWVTWKLDFLKVEKKKAAQFTCFMVVSIPVVQTCLTTAWGTH